MIVSKKNKYACTIQSICEAIKSQDPLQWTLQDNDRTLSTVLQIGHRKATLKLSSQFYSLNSSTRQSEGEDSLPRWCITGGECFFEGAMAPIKIGEDHARMLYSFVEQSLAQNTQPIRRRLQQVLSDLPQEVSKGGSRALSDWRIEVSSIEKKKGASEPAFVFYRDIDNIRIRVSEQMKRTFGLSRRVCVAKAFLIDHIVQAEESVHGRVAADVYDSLAKSCFPSAT